MNLMTVPSMVISYLTAQSTRLNNPIIIIIITSNYNSCQRNFLNINTHSPPSPKSYMESNCILLFRDDILNQTNPDKKLQPWLLCIQNGTSTGVTPIFSSADWNIIPTIQSVHLTLLYGLCLYICLECGMWMV